MHDEVLFESWSKFPIVLGCNSEYAENCDLSYQLQCQAERQGPWTSCYHKLTWGHKCEKKNIQTTSSGQPHWQSKWHLPGNLTGRANGIFLETSLAEQMASSWQPHWQSKWHLPGNLTGRANGIFLATSLAEQMASSWQPHWQSKFIPILCMVLLKDQLDEAVVKFRPFYLSLDPGHFWWCYCFL